MHKDSEAPMFDNGFATLYQADARQLPIPDESIDCVVTSPPYWGLRDYGLDEQGLGLEPTPEEYCANMVAVFREVWRVLKPTGTVWMNLGDSYAGSGRGPSRWNPAQEMWSDQTPPTGLKPKDLVGIPWRVAFALQADGWYLRSDIIWSKPNPMPESVTDRPTKAHEYVFLLTKSQRYYYDAEAVREPYNQASLSRYNYEFGHGPAAAVTNNPSVGDGTGHMALPNPAGRNKRSVWEIATQPYPEAHFATFPEKLVEPCILAGTSERGVCAECGKPWERIVERDIAYDHVTTQPGKQKDGPYELQTGNGIGTHDIRHGVYSIHTQKGWQPTCECNAETVPAAVLDPFVGSGTTLAVAQRLGRKGIGTDLNAEYIHMATERLSQITLPMLLV